MLSGSAFFLVMYQKERDTDRQILVVERQLNVVNQLLQHYLKMERDLNAFERSRNLFYQDEYQKSVKRVNELKPLLRPMFSHPEDEKVFTRLDSSLSLRMRQMERHMNYFVLMSPEEGQRKIRQEESEVIQARMSNDAHFDAIITILEGRSRSLEAEYLEYGRQNYRGFLLLMASWVVLFVITVVQTSRRIGLAERNNQNQQVLEAVQASEEKISNLIAAANVGTWEWNVQTGETRHNQRWAEMIGYTLDELQPVNISVTESLVHPEDWQNSKLLLNECFGGKREYYDFEYRMKHKDGQWVWVHDRGKVINWTPDRKPLWMFGTHMEITARKKAEEEVHNMNLKLKAANEELEKFASIASHDMREPLRMIKSFMDLLEKNYAPQLDEKAKKYIDFARDGAERMTVLINDLLSYARTGFEGASKEEIDVNNLIDQIRLLQRAVMEEMKVQLVAVSLPRVKAVRTALLLLFQNLINNAIKFQAAGKQPVIVIEGEEKKKCWQFVVKDNGIGIGQQHHARIFGLFQRAHSNATYRGTGMGLATCKKIVEQHGGEIWVESEEGKGSSFYFTIAKGG
jgi:PAS domain S-box-containing protein